MPSTMLAPMTLGEWMAEGARRFGGDQREWRFVCPCCKHVATPREWHDAGATEGEIAYSCIGRHRDKARDAFKRGKGPCNYAGGGLFKLNPQPVDMGDGIVYLFAFAEPEARATQPGAQGEGK